MPVTTCLGSGIDYSGRVCFVIIPSVPWVARKMAPTSGPYAWVLCGLALGSAAEPVISSSPVGRTIS